MKIKKILQGLFFRLQVLLGRDRISEQVAPYFDKFFIEDQYYLSPKISLADFCDKANIPADILNKYLRLKYKIGFEELCDHYVVKEIIEIRRDSDDDGLPVHLMAEGRGIEKAEAHIVKKEVSGTVSFISPKLYPGKKGQLK